MVPHYVLIFLGGPAEALFAVLTPVGVVFGVDGDDVALKARRVRGAVLTVLALVHLPATVGLHVLLQFVLLPEAPFTPFAFKRQVLGVNGEDVPTEYKRIGRFEVTVPTLVDLFPFMGLAMLFELRGPVEAFLTHLTLVGKILGVHRNDVSLQVTGVGALVVTVGTLVSLMPLEELRVLLQLLLVGEGLGTVLTFKGQVGAVFGFDVSFQVGLVSTPEHTVLTLVWLFPRVGPHVLFQLRGVAEALPALHAHMREVLAMDCEQVPVEEPLLCSLIVTIFALVELGLLVPQDEFIGTQRARLSVSSCVLCKLVCFINFIYKFMAFQMIVETYFFVSCKVTVCTLVFLLICSFRFFLFEHK